jgi:hypothetical protein
MHDLKYNHIYLFNNALEQGYYLNHLKEILEKYIKNHLKLNWIQMGI